MPRAFHSKSDGHFSDIAELQKMFAVLNSSALGTGIRMDHPTGAHCAFLPGSSRGAGIILLSSRTSLSA